MQQKSYKKPAVTGSRRFDAAGFWFAAGLVIVAMIAIYLNAALGVWPDPDMSFLHL